MLTSPFIPKLSSYPTGIDILDVFDVALSCLFRFIQLFMQPTKGKKWGHWNKAALLKTFLVYENIPAHPDLD